MLSTYFEKKEAKQNPKTKKQANQTKKRGTMLLGRTNTRSGSGTITSRSTTLVRDLACSFALRLSNSIPVMFRPYLLNILSLFGEVLREMENSLKIESSSSSSTATNTATDSLSVSTNDSDSISTLLSKSEINEIRSTYFCKKLSVSYSNTSTSNTSGGIESAGNNTGGLLLMKGRGTKLYDEHDHEYLDTRNNVCHVGHCHPYVVDAVHSQLRSLNTNTRYLHPNVALLAKRILSKLPDPLEVIFFVNSGSEANDLALRLSRCYSGGSKNTIVVDRAYHGHTIACTEISPFKYENSQETILIENGPHKTPGSHIWKVPCPDTFRGPHRNPNTAGYEYAQYVKEACEHYYTAKNEKVAAFIIESGMALAGVILPPRNYLKHAVEYVRNAGGLFIADEVQTGFGRYGTHFWAFQHNNIDVVPDIVTMAKPIGNGMPLAAVATTKKVAEAYERIGPEYFNTYGGNPVCTAAGLAVMDVLEQEHLPENARIVGTYMKQKLLKLKDKLDNDSNNASVQGIIGDVRGCGFFLGIELVRPNSSENNTMEPATEETSLIITKLKDDHRILTSVDGKQDNVIIVKPPMVFNKKDADYFLEALEHVLTVDLIEIGIENIIGNTTRTPT